MKHRGISLLLVVTFLLSLFMFCTTAFAAVNEQDGLSAELITDKQEYTAGEEVGITLRVKNTSAYVSNIWAKLQLPAILTLKSGDLDSGVLDIAVGGEEEFSYTADTPAPAPVTTVAGTTGNPDGPSDTGDISLYIFGAIAVFSLIGLVVVVGGFKGLFKQRWFVLVLCLALLLPVVAPLAASAAVTEKFFEVTTTVKVDGVDAEIKATITYDFDDGIYPAAEVEFKADGESLYKLVGEKGWYTPANSSIVVDGVAASNTSRPEVDASYISMLFGCVSTKTGNAVPGILDNSQIISEDATKELLVGRTEDKASLKALDLIGQDEWIIAEIDGKIVVTGWYDDATVAAVQHLYSLVNGQDDVTLSLPIKGDVDGYVADIPDLEDATFLGGMNSSGGTVTLRYSDADEAAFDAYGEKLLADGYTLYAENEILCYGEEYNLFRTYVKGEAVVHISYLSNAFMEADYASLSANEKAYYDRSFRPLDGPEVRVVIDSKGALFTNEDSNDYEDLGITPKVSIVNLYNKVADGNNNAECLIYTLADGSFIVADGGFTQDAKHVFDALAELNERPDGKIVVAAWIMSHHHGDHVGAIKTMATADYAEDIIIEQFIFNPTAESYSWRHVNAPFNYAADFNYSVYNHEYMTELLANFGGDTQIVNPHMGQEMYIRNAVVEFMYTGDEDLYPIHMDNTNDSSIVYTVNFDMGTEETEDDTCVLMLNDSCVDSQYAVLMPLYAHSMDNDIVQVGHHGLGGPSTATYRMMEPTVGIWCSTMSTAVKNNWFVEKTGGGTKGGSAGFLLYRKADDDNDPIDLLMLAEDYVQTLELPYAAGDPVIKRGLGSYKSNMFELNKLRLASLGIGGLGDDLDENLDAVAAYLMEVDAEVLGLTGISKANAEALAEAAGYPYVGFAAAPGVADDADGVALLSYYPIAAFSAVDANGASMGYALVNVEDVMVDVLVVNLDAITQTNGVAVQSQGHYQIIMGVTNGELPGLEVAVTGNADENIYAGTALASGVTLVDGKLENAGAKTGVEDLEKLVSATAVLSRKHLMEDFDEGSFDDVTTLAVWWANYVKDLTNKEQVLSWILKNKPEIIGLDHMPMELLSDEGAAEFAALAGYEYYAWVRVHTVDSSTAYGPLLLSHYPIEDVSSVVLRADGAEGGEGRAYLRATVTLPSGEKVDVYVGDTDGNATNKAAQLAVLEAAVKARSEENSGRNFIILSCDAAISETFAGKTLKVYTEGGNSIAVSGDFPMDGMRTYGTKAYPHEGRSPIGTTLANIDKYSKVELADLPEYTLTVNGGTGSGEFQEGEEVYAMAAAPGKGMAFNGWTAEGITLEDPMAKEQIFEMPANTVKLTATYKAVAYAERNETGSTSGKIKVAVLPTYRWQGKFAEFKDQIVENIKTVGADVIAITITDYDASCKRNSIDPVPVLKEALAEEYTYSYFAPAYEAGTTSTEDPGAGYVGHLLLSKYPILSSESIELNTESSEVRAAGHVVINVGTESEPTRLGVYFSHMGAGHNWNSGKNDLYEVVANADEDAYVMIGKLHYTDNKTIIAQKLGNTVVAKDANLTIFGSENITIEADSYGENATLKDAWVAAGYAGIEKLYYATVSMPLYEDGDIKYPVSIIADGETTVNGWYAANEAITVTAPAAPAGYKFDGWTLPTGLVLTEGDATTATIKFTMPAAAVELNMAYAENPTGTVVFNVNGGTGTIADVTANVGNYTLPTAATGILSPAGKKFAGWGLTATATKADAVNTAVVTKDATTTVYAIWEDTDEVNYLTWWIGNLRSTSDAAAIKEELLKRDADVVALVSARVEINADLSAYAASIGYTYHQYVEPYDPGRGNILLSKYPFEKKGQDGYMSWFQATINGEKIDIYTGYDCNGKFTAIKNQAVASGNDFVLLGHTFGNANYTAFDYGRTIASINSGNTGTVVSLDKWAVVGTPAVSEISVSVSSVNDTKVVPMTVRMKAYTVTFDAGEGSGNQAPIYTDGGNVALPTTTTFTAPTGKVFAGWSETAGGAVISGNSINITGNKTLYAVWQSTFTATVTEGTGSGTYTIGDTVTLTANAAPSGKVFSYWEGLNGITLAEGYNAVSSTLKFTMPGNDVNVQAVYREIGKIKVASVYANKFGNGGYSGSNVEKINAELLAANADIMAVVAVDDGAMKKDDTGYVWNGETLTALLKLMKNEYPYSYFAKAWYVYHDPADASADSTKGWFGHLILSKFPLDSEATITQTAGNVSTEGRACAAVTVTVDGVKLDVYAMANGSYAAWNAVVGDGKSVAGTINASTSDAWIAMGNLHYSSAANKGYIDNYLDEDSAGVDIDNDSSTYTDYMVGSTNLVYSDKYNMSTDEKTDLIGSNRAPNMHWQTATVTLPVTWASVSFEANGGSGTMSSVSVPAGTAQTLPACSFTAPAGHTFKGWSLTADGDVLSGDQVVPRDTTLYAIWEPITLKVGYFSSYKFGANKYSTYATEINNAIIGSGLDVLVINQLEKGGTTGLTGQWDNDDVAGKIVTAVAETYPHSYFASAGLLCGDQTGEYGNLILSKYPIDLANSETISLYDGTAYTLSGTSYTGFVEGRPAGRARLNVAGYTVDVYYTHAENANQGKTLAGKIAEMSASANAADSWIATGFIPGIDTHENLPQSAYKTAGSGNTRFMGSTVFTFGTMATDATSFTVGGYTITAYSNSITLPDA